jgi:hypothetical protein
MKTILVRALLVLLAIFVVAFFARGFIAKKAVEIGAEKMTGFPLEVGEMSVGMALNNVEAKNIKLKNSEEFGGSVFVDMPELKLDYHLLSMAGSQPHVKEMFLHINEMIIVKNAQGQTNVMKLKDIASSGEGDSKYRVDVLRIKVGKVVYRTYKADGTFTDRNFAADLDVTYKDLTESTQVTKLVVLAVMSKVKLPDLGINVADLKKGLGNVANAAGKLLKEGGDVLYDVGKGALDAGKGAIDNIKRLLPGGGTKD